MHLVYSHVAAWRTLHKGLGKAHAIIRTTADGGEGLSRAHSGGYYLPHLPSIYATYVISKRTIVHCDDRAAVAKARQAQPCGDKDVDDDDAWRRARARRWLQWTHAIWAHVRTAHYVPQEHQHQLTGASASAAAPTVPIVHAPTTLLFTHTESEHNVRAYACRTDTPTHLWHLWYSAVHFTRDRVLRVCSLHCARVGISANA